MQVDPAWKTEYITTSCVDIPENCLEGHVLGIDFDDQHGFTKQFKSAVEEVKKARANVPLIDHVSCEVAVSQSCLGVCKVGPSIASCGAIY